MTTIHSIVEPRKHVRVIAIGDGDVALDIGRPGRPAISLAAIRVPVADLRAALNDFAPAGSYTRTDDSRPLAPDDITDEMVKRARDAFTKHSSVHVTIGPDLVRKTIAAALTEPTSPEEKVEAVLNQYWSGDIDGTDLAALIVEEMNR